MKGDKGSGGHGRRGGGKGAELVAEHGYDTKFAMHAARPGYQGIELVTSGRLNLPIAGEPGEWLRAVCRGEVPLPNLYERIENLDDQLSELEGTISTVRVWTLKPSTPSLRGYTAY